MRLQPVWQNRPIPVLQCGFPGAWFCNSLSWINSCYWTLTFQAACLNFSSFCSFRQKNLCFGAEKARYYYHRYFTNQVFVLDCIIVFLQLKTPSCQPSSTTPTAPRSTSNSRPPMSCTWLVDSCCRHLIGLTCLLRRERIRSSLLLTRWWAWWRGSFRSVPLHFKSSF